MTNLSLYHLYPIVCPDEGPLATRPFEVLWLSISKGEDGGGVKCLHLSLIALCSVWSYRDWGRHLVRDKTPKRSWCVQERWVVGLKEWKQWRSTSCQDSQRKKGKCECALRRRLPTREIEFLLVWVNRESKVLVWRLNPWLRPDFAGLKSVRCWRKSRRGADQRHLLRPLSNGRNSRSQGL